MKKLLGWPLPNRMETIEQKVNENPRPEKKYPLKFRNEMTQFDVHSVPIEMLKYRIANGRTLAAQEEYLSEHPELDKDFFDDNNVENTEVQLGQHEILTKMLKSPKGNLKTVFKKEKQEKPLIITREGFVVNGNRRLCTWRELFNEDPNQFVHFKYIDVIILPHCTEEEIDRLEAQLQLIKDIKDDYGWVTEAKMYSRRHIKHNYSYEQLSGIYDIPVKEVEYKLSLLTYVDEYLEKIGKPHEYNLIEKDEYAFRQIKKFKEQLTDVEKRDIFQALAFNVISSPKSESDGRLYEYIPKISKSIDPIISRLTSEINIEESPKTELDDLLNMEEEEVVLGNLAVTLDKMNKEEQKHVVTVVKEIIDTLEELEGEKELRNYSFNKVKRANTFLQEAYLGFNEQTNINGMEEQLHSLEKIINNLRKAITQHVVH